jgi:hypothetical protein
MKKTVRELARDDKGMLQRVLDHHADLSDHEKKVFHGLMYKITEAEKAGNVRKLTFGELSWVTEVAKRLDVVEPAANLVSRGLVARGKDVVEPEILRHRPLKPPGRS